MSGPSKLDRGAPSGQPADRAWTVQHIIANPRLRAIAFADSRFHGNKSARLAYVEYEKRGRRIPNGDDAA